LLLPRLLAQLADLQLSRGRRTEASELLQEADDILEGFSRTRAAPGFEGESWEAWTRWCRHGFVSRVNARAQIPRGYLPCSSVHAHDRWWTCCIRAPSAKFAGPRTCAPPNAASRHFRCSCF